MGILPEGQALKVRLINKLTGEEDEALCYRPKQGKREGFFMVFETYITDLILEYRLSGLEFRLLWLMMKLMDHDNVVYESQAELARTLETKPEVLSKAIKSLIESDAICLYKRLGNTKVYQVSPLLACRTKHDNHKRLIAQWDKRKKYTGKDFPELTYLEESNQPEGVKDMTIHKVKKHVTESLLQSDQPAKRGRKPRKKAAS